MATREDHIDSPISSRGRGVLIVADDPARRMRLTAALDAIDADVVEAPSGHAAMAILKAGVPPDVLVLDATLTDAPGLALCRHIRASAALAATYVLILSHDRWQASDLERAEADDYLQVDAADSLFRSRVRAGLRSQAHRRVLARRERRRAIEWLGAIVAHEVNNPLAVALTGMECMRELLRAPGPDAAQLTELRRWAVESDTVLRRIHDTAVRLTRPQDELTPGGPEALQAEELGTALHEAVHSCYAGPVTVATESTAHQPLRVDRHLLISAVQAITRAAAAHCRGALHVALGIDDFRIATILEFEGAPDFDPERILEPRLQSFDGLPPVYAPGLSIVEQAFARFGGQIFARPRGERWRFGLTLPVFEPAGDS